MAKSRSLEDELKQWKNKYFDLREDFDAETKDAEAFRSVLQRMLLRLCLSAEGQSTRFEIGNDRTAENSCEGNAVITKGFWGLMNTEQGKSSDQLN